MKVLQGKSIFVVEDDPTNLAVIRVVLQNAGANVPFDYWGDTTLSKMMGYTGRLDLILLDIMLPHGRSGYDVFDAIRAEPRLEGIPIVAVTASDPDLEMPKVKAKGFSGYISKPIDRHQLPLDLQKILEGEPVWRR